MSLGSFHDHNWDKVIWYNWDKVISQLRELNHLPREVYFCLLINQPALMNGSSGTKILLYEFCPLLSPLPFQAQVAQNQRGWVYTDSSLADPVLTFHWKERSCSISPALSPQLQAPFSLLILALEILWPQGEPARLTGWISGSKLFFNLHIYLCAVLDFHQVNSVNWFAPGLPDH